MSTTPTYEELLGMAEWSAVHLEMRDGYMTSDPQYVAWKAGRRDNPDDRAQWWNSWHDLISETVGRGVRVRRARVVSEPVSEYIRFEHSITYQNVVAGEEVRWLPRRRASGLALPGNDFWLIDERLALWNHFTGEGEFAPGGNEVSEDPSSVKLCSSAFEAVWELGIDHGDYEI